MASKLGKFERTFVVCEFVVTTTKFLQKLVVNRTTAANFFPPNFVALLCHVTGMRTKVQMIDFVVVVVVVVGSKGLYCQIARPRVSLDKPLFFRRKFSTFTL